MIVFSPSPVVAEQQMTAIIFYLTTFGYIDGQLDMREKVFIHEYIRQLVGMRVAEMVDLTPDEKVLVVDRQTAYFERVFDRVHAEIRKSFDEVVAAGESVEEFVLAKLRLRCFELFKTFDGRSQQTLLTIIDKLVAADGVTDAREKRFRDELVALLQDNAEPRRTMQLDVGAARGPMVRVLPPTRLVPAMDNHALLAHNEQHYSRQPSVLARQINIDAALIRQAVAAWDEQRRAGQGRLTGKRNVAELGGAPFLDGFVYAHPAPAAGREVELIVLGDLHGCYSCLKAALLQSDFFRKVAAFRKDPVRNPDVKLVLLGDYVDRGMYSFNGVLRAALQLFVSMPDHVYVLRGNHEYYLDLGDRVISGVTPAESISSLEHVMPKSVFDGWLALFEAMPSMLLFDRTLFVHAGIPRDQLVEERWRDLSSLNDKDLRFQMMWSDPCNANHVPHELQSSNARFPFGRQQFRAFMGRLGCNTMVRGHEKIDEGFKKVYDEGDVQLLNLFSSGGATNADLPEGASYRTVTPMALTIRHGRGEPTATPWPIDYAPFNTPERNGFYRSRPEIAWRMPQQVA